MTVSVKPIPFTAPMVQALLREIEAPGTGKPQTRRIIKPGPPPCQTGPNAMYRHGGGWRYSGVIYDDQVVESCPYGKPGDLLYVRESYFQRGHWEPVNGKKTKGGKQKWEFTPESHEIQFAEPDEYRKARDAKDPFTVAWHKRLGRFMPRRYSRITLEVTDLRVERLMDITRGDCMSEGCPFQNMADGPDPRDWFKELFQSIHGEDVIKANPWLWAVSFTPHLINVDQFIKERAAA